ncbi:hypothetical protein OGAPHI_006671 [Ogataea philodendri]|uniref:Uncharacterized protein n=1 Tax=Ogataea philodendri TaxID=1378263 RepID=A0A9P8T0K2_9ASCO|nr:uncharacterized protein OGAPHI_006671 [Ogataea philodendri]KAH3661264.1 hypothetical protein OGAPHI_006671 [Ogataea philodendri]
MKTATKAPKPPIITSSPRKKLNFSDNPRKMIGITDADTRSAISNDSWKSNKSTDDTCDNSSDGRTNNQVFIRLGSESTQPETGNKAVVGDDSNRQDVHEHPSQLVGMHELVLSCVFDVEVDVYLRSIRNNTNNQQHQDKHRLETVGDKRHLEPSEESIDGCHNTLHHHGRSSIKTRKSLNRILNSRQFRQHIKEHGEDGEGRQIQRSDGTKTLKHPLEILQFYSSSDKKTIAEVSPTSWSLSSAGWKEEIGCSSSESENAADFFAFGFLTTFFSFLGFVTLVANKSSLSLLTLFPRLGFFDFLSDLCSFFGDPFLPFLADFAGLVFLATGSASSVPESAPNSAKWLSGSSFKTGSSKSTVSVGFSGSDPSSSASPSSSSSCTSSSSTWPSPASSSAASSLLPPAFSKQSSTYSLNLLYPFLDVWSFNGFSNFPSTSSRASSSCANLTASQCSVNVSFGKEVIIALKNGLVAPEYSSLPNNVSS